MTTQDSRGMTDAAIWNHKDRMASDPQYRAWFEAFNKPDRDECSVPGCERTEPCESAETGWCGLA